MKRGQTAELRHRSARKLALKLGARTRAIWTDQRGVAAIEFGFFAIFLAAGARKRYRRLNLRLPANAGGKCNPNCSTGGVEGLRLAEIAGDDKLPWADDRHAERIEEHLARHARFADGRLAVRGVLLRQLIERAAIRQRCLLQACRLHSCGYAELAAR